MDGPTLVKNIRKYGGVTVDQPTLNEAYAFFQKGMEEAFKELSLLLEEETIPFKSTIVDRGDPLFFDVHIQTRAFPQGHLVCRANAFYLPNEDERDTFAEAIQLYFFPDNPRSSNTISVDPLIMAQLVKMDGGAFPDIFLSWFFSSKNGLEKNPSLSNNISPQSENMHTAGYQFVIQLIQEIYKYKAFWKDNISFNDFVGEQYSSAMVEWRRIYQ